MHIFNSIPSQLSPGPGPGGQRTNVSYRIDSAIAPDRRPAPAERVDSILVATSRPRAGSCDVSLKILIFPLFDISSSELRKLLLPCYTLIFAYTSRRGHDVSTRRQQARDPRLCGFFNEMY